MLLNTLNYIYFHCELSYITYFLRVDIYYLLWKDGGRMDAKTSYFFKKYYHNQNELLRKYNIEIPDVFLKEEIL